MDRKEITERASIDESSACVRVCVRERASVATRQRLRNEVDVAVLRRVLQRQRVGATAIGGNNTAERLPLCCARRGGEIAGDARVTYANKQDEIN